MSRHVEWSCITPLVLGSLRRRRASSRVILSRLPSTPGCTRRSPPAHPSRLANENGLVLDDADSKYPISRNLGQVADKLSRNRLWEVGTPLQAQTRFVIAMHSPDGVLESSGGTFWPYFGGGAILVIGVARIRDIWSL